MMNSDNHEISFSFLFDGELTTYNGSLGKVTNTLTLTVACRDGDQVAMSDPINVGFGADENFELRIVFQYNYDPVENVLAFHGSDSSDLRATSALITTPSKYGAESVLGTARLSPKGLVWSAGWTDDDQSKTIEQFNPGTLRKLLEEFNLRIIDNLIASGLDSVVCKSDPPIVTNSNINQFEEMYGFKDSNHLSKSVVDRVICLQNIVNSTWVANVTWNQQTVFANVIGSTHDPKPSGYNAWLRLWADKCNGGFGTNKCSSQGWFSVTGYSCSSTFVGGHVILGKTDQALTKGQTVYIFPICNVHNGVNASYMTSLYNPVGMQLKYWL